MALTRAVKDRLVTQTKDNLARATTLYTRLALNGGFRNGQDFSPLMHPDRRDVATFIFFEAAAQYESFCAEAFKLEVRKAFSVQPKYAINIMGSSDRGLAGVMGWASPSVVQERARHLFGKSGFFGRLETILGSSAYNTLIHAHKVRNRVAHNGGNAVSDYRKVLGQLGVPQRSRRGMSVGRLLMDYPIKAAARDRWFDRFLKAYLTAVEAFDSHVVI